MRAEHEITLDRAARMLGISEQDVMVLCNRRVIASHTQVLADGTRERRLNRDDVLKLVDEGFSAEDMAKYAAPKVEEKRDTSVLSRFRGGTAPAEKTTEDTAGSELPEPAEEPDTSAEIDEPAATTEAASTEPEPAAAKAGGGVLSRLGLGRRDADEEDAERGAAPPAESDTESAEDVGQALSALADTTAAAAACLDSLADSADCLAEQQRQLGQKAHADALVSTGAALREAAERLRGASSTFVAS